MIVNVSTVQGVLIELEVLASETGKHLVNPRDLFISDINSVSSFDFMLKMYS